MTNSKTKLKFQSTEDYLKDYEAYKKGYKYKVLYADASDASDDSDYKSMYVYWVSDIFKQRLSPVGVVDLALKFRNIW